MLSELTEVAAGSPWTYAAVLAAAVLDAGLPVVPSETTLIAAAALAGSGRLDIGLILLAAAAGAFLGDNLVYAAGRGLGPRLRRWFGRRDATRRRLVWADEQLGRRGGMLIVVSRFIPGGRTATMLTAGALAMPWRRFAVYDATAAVLWAAYGGGLGYAGGTAFEHEPLKGVALAFGLALAMAALFEAWRRRPRPRTPREETA